MSDALLSTREDPCQTVPNAKPAHTSPILPPLESNEAFLAVIHALRDAEVSSPDRTRSIDAIIAKTTAGTGSPRINKNGVMAIYTIASSLAETFQNPTFQQDPKEPIHSFVSNLPDMFEPGSWMRSVIASDLPRNRRETLIYGTFFIWLDRTYFRHKGARVPEPILRYLQEDHVQTQGVHFLKASLDRMGSNNDNHRNRHLELGFCLLSGDDSLEIAELVEEAKRPENQWLDKQSCVALEKIETGFRTAANVLKNEFQEQINSTKGAATISDISKFLIKTDRIVDRFGVHINLMNWSMQPYAEEPAHRPYILLLRNHIDRIEKSVRDVLDIVSDIEKLYPANSPWASSQNGMLVSVLRLRMLWLQYNLCKIQINTAPSLFEQRIHKGGGKTQENHQIYAAETERFTKRIELGEQNLSQIIALCDDLASREPRYAQCAAAAPWDNSGWPSQMRTGDLIDAIIGHATTSLDADKNRALEQREKRRTYGILCNFSYLPLILARYESRLESSVRRDIESGISNILLMQEERDPNTLNDVDLVTAENAQTRRLQFIRNFAQVPPENPDIFRETVENAYQLFRTLPAEERTDDLLSMLADTLMRRLQEVWSRRTSLQASLLLFEVTQALRLSYFRSPRGSKTLSGTLSRISQFAKTNSSAGSSSDSLGRICLELARVSAIIGADLCTNRKYSVVPKELKQECFESLRRALYLHPNFSAVLSSMEADELQRISVMLDIQSPTDLLTKTRPAKDVLVKGIRSIVMTMGSRERSRALTNALSKEIATTVNELLETEDAQHAKATWTVINHLRTRLTKSVFAMIGEKIFHGRWVVHMAILKPESFKTSEVPDSSAILSAAVKNEEISRDQRITPLVIHPWVVIFVAHEPTVSSQIRSIIQSEGLEDSMERLCDAILDLQDGLDGAKLAKKCIEALLPRKRSGMMNACAGWVIDPDTGIASALAGDSINENKTPENRASSVARAASACYLAVTDAGEAQEFKKPGSESTHYFQSLYFQTSTRTPPSCLRPGATIFLQVVPQWEYLSHLVRNGIISGSALATIPAHEVAALENTVPLIGTISHVSQWWQVDVMITGPLTFARHYLTTMRAARSAGVVYIDERSIQGSNSEHGMLTAQSQITTGNRGQTVAPRVLMSGPGWENMRGVCSFLGPDSLRVVFELSRDAISRLGPFLATQGDLTVAVNILSDLRANLVSALRNLCRKDETAKGEMVTKYLDQTLQRILDNPQASPGKNSRIWTETARKIHWGELIKRTIRAAIPPEKDYTPDAVDEIIRTVGDDLIEHTSSHDSIFHELLALPGLDAAKNPLFRITIDSKTLELSTATIDHLKTPLITMNPHSGLVELTFRYTRSAESNKFVRSLREKLLWNDASGMRSTLL